MDDDGEDCVAVGAEEARRAAVLRPLVQAYLKGTGSLESGINDAVWELGVSRATVWRWIKRLAEEGGRSSALAPRKRGRPTGTTLISSRVEAAIEEHLRRYFLRRERSSLSRVVTEIRSACWQQGLQPPTRRTVQHRLDALDAREVAKAREGAKAARQKFAPVTGENKASQPLEIVQIDHTPADIILVDSFVPFEMEAFRVSFLPSELRKVRRDGIHLFQIRYWSDALAGHIGRGDGKVVVRYDPRDISMIWVELGDGRYVEARYRNLEIPPVSLWEYRDAIRKAPDAEAAIREVLASTVADPAPLIAATPEDGEDEILYFEDETLSIWRCRFHPHEAIPAHEHKLKVLIAGYAGGETSALYRRGPGGLEHIETVTARAGDVITLDRDAIHTVTTEGGAP